MIFNILWGFVKFCLLLIGNTVMTVVAVLDVISVVIALAIILDKNVPEDIWKRKER